MTYTIKEIFYTLQGEGAQAGRAAVFCRFSGCNLWSGREEDRSRAVCQFCDTDFIGTGPDGGRFRSANEVADAIDRCWEGGGGGRGGRSARQLRAEPSKNGYLKRDESDSREQYSAASPAADVNSVANNGVRKYVVCTGGEPLLQLDEDLISELHRRDFDVAVETNGTRPAPVSLDWVCVSPKAGAPLVQTRGNELKLVYPQDNAPPEKFAQLDFQHFFLQPMDGPDVARNTELAIEYCLRHPRWRLSIQTHKLVGLR